MEQQMTIDFERIKDAIEYLDANYKQHPSLDEVAAYIHLSPMHFQRMFTQWAGVSPKQFLQYTTVAHAKQLLKNSGQSLFSTSHDLGLSSSSRLHDLFVRVEAMTPTEYRNRGANLQINYQFASTLFGNVLIASTPKGICSLQFVDSVTDGLLALAEQYTHAQLTEGGDKNQAQAIAILSDERIAPSEIKLHIRGTAFQLKVWDALLKIPQGNLLSYGKIADEIGCPKASRAVGTAIGSNPIAYIIPCHRVIQSSGAFGGYRWHMPRKKAIIAWESAHNNFSPLLPSPLRGDKRGVGGD